jgi:ADP-heptose:LPS heptosyltransferase
VSPHLPHQGRHPGDADRRGNGRALNILLIRLRLIGDVVFTTPAVRALRRHFPDARLTYLVEAAAAPVIAHEPALDEVIIVDRPRGLARLAYDFALARRLRQARFDLAIDFHGGPRSAWLARASGAPRRIGYAVPGRTWAYTDRIPWSPDLVPPRHSVLNQWDLLVPLGIAGPEPAADPVAMVLDPSAEARVDARLDAAGVPPQARLVVVHVSAGNPFRRWPPESFATVAATLAADDPARRIIITSGPSEMVAAAAIAERARALVGSSAADRIVRSAEFDLTELGWLLQRAVLFIGGDSGPLHIAGTTQVPVVAIFGPTLPARSLPWRDPATPAIAVEAGPLPCRPCHQRHCVPGDFRCLTSITAEQVIQAARKIISDLEIAD